MQIISLRKKRGIINEDGERAAAYCVLGCAPHTYERLYKRERFVVRVDYWEETIARLKRSDCIQHMRNMGLGDILDLDAMRSGNGVHTDTLRSFLADHCATPDERRQKAEALREQLGGPTEPDGDEAQPAGGVELDVETLDADAVIELAVALDSGDYNATRSAYKALGIGAAPGNKADLFAAARLVLSKADV